MKFKVILKLSLLIGLCTAGRLELNPRKKAVTKLAGEDKSFFISCIPISHTGPVSDSRIKAKELSWKKKQNPAIGNGWVTLGSVQHTRVHVEQSADARGLDLVFRNIQSEDEGEYSCEAIIDGRKEQKIFHLKVIEPISFDGTSQIQSVEDGSKRFTLKCKVSGNPRPRLTWNVRGKILRPGDSDDGGKYTVTPLGLVIVNVTQADKGAYKCKATQLDEDITDFQEMIIDLKVQHKPIWKARQRSIFYGFISGTSNLTCEAEAEPPASFAWFDQRGKPIREGAILTENQISTLVLPITHDDIFGEYSCEATNKMGSLARKVKLSEGAKPGIPNLEIYKIDTESAQMTILEHPAELHLRIIGFEIEYKEKHLDWDLAYHQYFLKSPSSLYKVSGLLPKTFYHFRARARNLAGYSDHSNMIYLQTSATHAVGELLGSATTASKASVTVITIQTLMLCSVLLLIR
eukprot:14311.XXX_1102105_1132754_1 [CDS] Oithona nana genome sequencing.